MVAVIKGTPRKPTLDAPTPPGKRGAGNVSAAFMSLEDEPYPLRYPVQASDNDYQVGEAFG